MSTAEYIDIAEVAKLIRAQLAKDFTGIKFSVRSQRYSMGCHVSVSWDDGPTQSQVDRAIGQFSGKTFDGMDDSTHYHDSEWNGKPVHFAGSRPSCQRHVSNYQEWERMAREIILRRCHCEGGRFGNQYVDHLAAAMVGACDFRENDPLERAFRRIVMREESWKQ